MFRLKLFLLFFFFQSLSWSHPAHDFCQDFIFEYEDTDKRGLTRSCTGQNQTDCTRLDLDSRWFDYQTCLDIIKVTDSKELISICLDPQNARSAGCQFVSDQNVQDAKISNTVS